MGIVILEDDVIEGDESFQVVVEEFDASATVTILDDDGISININFTVSFHKAFDSIGMTASYVGNSPVVVGNTASFDLTFRGDVASASCALLVGNKIQSETDCKILELNSLAFAIMSIPLMSCV